MWIGSIQVIMIIFLIVLKNFEEHLAIYCINWVIHFVVFVCFGLLRWSKINKRKLLRIKMVLLYVRIVLSIVQKQDTVSIKDPEKLLRATMLGIMMNTAGVMHSFLITYLFQEYAMILIFSLNLIEVLALIIRVFGFENIIVFWKMALVTFTTSMFTIFLFASIAKILNRITLERK